MEVISTYLFSMNYPPDIFKVIKVKNTDNLNRRHFLITRKGLSELIIN
jgi:uncharacterized protein with PQ loop repeat